MNKQSRHGYSKGMNQDLAKDKYANGAYFEMHNFRVITNEGLSTGSIEVESGMTLSFKVPDLPSMTLDNGDVIPAQTDLRIIGAGNINNTIVIFTTNETSDTPNGYGQIWKLKWDENNSVVEDLTAANELDPDIHLVYNNLINFSTHHRIGRVIGRYETETIQRVYWTDNYNPLRTINIADTDAINIDPENLDIRPSIDYAQPIFKKVGTGSIQVGSTVQYAYRLLDTSGAQTLYSPVSNPIWLTALNPYSTSSIEMEGDPQNESSSRSVTYTITGLDTDYQVIEHVVIIYETKNSPKIYKFREDSIPSDGVMEITHTGTEDYFEISLLEFNELSSGFNVCKDIDVKNNKLIAANIKNEQFDLDFDARAYRFNNLREGLIKDGDLGDITIDGATETIVGSGASWTTIDEEHDAINPYNDESDPNWPLLNQYKFQSDGVTIGGSGPNISYKIVEHEFYGDGHGIDSTADHVSVDYYGGFNLPTTVLGMKNPDGSDVGIIRAGELSNNAGYHNSCYFKGYARGETYRFGIVFYSKKGSPSFVKWIGDIKMPEPVDGFPTGDYIAGYEKLFHIGVEFNVDLSSIADQISAFRIVRVERKEEDKTRLSTGSIVLFERQNAGNGTTLIERWQNGNAVPLIDYTNDTDINGSTNANIYHLNDKPGINSQATKEGFAYISPPSQFSTITPKAGDFIKTYGYYSANAFAYRHETGNDTYAFHYKCRGFVNSDHSAEYLEVEAGRKVNHGEYIESNTDILGSIGDVNSFVNASYCRDAGTDRHVPLGVGNLKFIGVLSNSPTSTHCVAYPSMNWYGSGNYSGMTFTGDTGSTVYFKEVAYCRYITDQYGGNTYEARSQNSYISTGHFQCINDNTGSSFTLRAFGGDIYVNYYECEYLKFYSDSAEVPENVYNDPVDTKLSVAVCMPCESSYNTDLCIGTRWSAYRDGSDFTSFSTVLPINDNNVYYQENNVEGKFFAKDFLSNFVTEQPNKIWASEQKINGELIDNWRIFKANNTIEVDGIYGPINRIINWKNTMYYFQDSAFGAVSINDRSVITDESGAQLIVGNGGTLDHFQNISTNTGSIHQFGVVSNDQGIYWFDARLKKFYRYSNQGNQPLSDLKGMSSYFAKNVSGAFTTDDHTLTEINDGAIGVHGVVDYRYNRVLFTFLNSKPVRSTQNNTNVDVTYNIGDIVDISGTLYEVITAFTLSPGGRISPTDPTLQEVEERFINGFTISYNEFLDSFESFYDFKPGLYYNYGRRLLSVSPFDKNRMYEHNRGNYCQYYGHLYPDSKITFLLNPDAGVAKIFNNIEFQSECTLLGADQYLESITGYRCYNEYQDTGDITLTVPTNLKRRIRQWRFEIGRDESDGKSRIRNPYTFLELKYENGNNRRFILHDIILSYTISRY